MRGGALEVKGGLGRGGRLCRASTPQRLDLESSAAEARVLGVCRDWHVFQVGGPVSRAQQPTCSAGFTRENGELQGRVGSSGLYTGKWGVTGKSGEHERSCDYQLWHTKGSL